jgi:hypothetical protein
MLFDFPSIPPPRTLAVVLVARVPGMTTHKFSRIVSNTLYLSYGFNGRMTDISSLFPRLLFFFCGLVSRLGSWAWKGAGLLIVRGDGYEVRGFWIGLDGLRGLVSDRISRWVSNQDRPSWRIMSIPIDFQGSPTYLSKPRVSRGLLRSSKRSSILSVRELSFVMSSL